MWTSVPNHKRSEVDLPVELTRVRRVPYGKGSIIFRYKFVWQAKNETIPMFHIYFQAQSMFQTFNPVRYGIVMG